MGSLPTCWYCPKCDQVGGGHKLECYSKTPPSPIKVPMIPPGTPLTDILNTLGIKYRGPIKVPMIPPGTPLTDILNTLGIKYREGRAAGRHAGAIRVTFDHTYPGQRVLVVDIPATDEAQA